MLLFFLTLLSSLNNNISMESSSTNKVLKESISNKQFLLTHYFIEGKQY